MLHDPLTAAPEAVSQALEATPMSQPEGSNAPAEGGSSSDDAAQQTLAAAAQEAEGSTDDSDDDEEDDSQSFDAAKARRRIDKANREAKNLREQLKQLKPLAEQAEKRRKEDLSEAERLKEEKQALEAQLSQLNAVNIRRDAAEAAGLPAKFTKFITATDPAEALAQAKELAKELKSDEKKPADFRQGARGSNNSGSTNDHDALLRAMARQR